MINNNNNNLINYKISLKLFFLLRSTFSSSSTINKPLIHGKTLAKQLISKYNYKDSAPFPIYYIDHQGLFKQHDLHRLLNQINLSTHSFIQVATKPAPPPLKQQSTELQWPVIKHITLDHPISKTKPTTTTTTTTTDCDTTEKEIRVGCNVATHDMQTKIDKAKGFLLKGYRVTLTVQYKKPSPVTKVNQVMDAFLVALKPFIKHTVTQPKLIGRHLQAVVVGLKTPNSV